jgi:hypothetical protein
VLDKKQHKLRILLGFSAIVSSAPFFINVGMFLGSFNDGMCYSRTIHDLNELSIFISNQKNSEHLDRYQKFLKSLPLHGYETSCDEVNETVVKFKTEILAVQTKP